MPEKKTSVSKNSKNTDRRMTKPQVPRTPPNSEPAHKTQVPTLSNGARQLATFEAAIKLFNARKFKEARDLFQEAAGGPERDVAQRSRVHTSMCERRLQQTPAVNLGTAEDCYNYGVAMINARNMAEARAHLEKALQLAPGEDHIHYALALAQGLSGDFASAHDNLRMAIELEPRNRMIARQDADFAPLVHQAAIHLLLFPEKKSW
ncbi:MAG: Tetratricopeptide 2 repeat protein [Candidatus Solibacter sp.]|jgi:tetratricopeptide (TPR) repeat protein|nr:Tetratricopeptide 2 repeat protein [Candidatus Solibacter sp.]